MGQLIAIEKWVENLDEVTVNEWLVAEGQAFSEGDSLCEIITDKATFEYELDRDGILVRTYCKAKSVVPVGYVIAFTSDDPQDQPPEGIDESNARLLSEHQAKTSLDLSLDLGDQARPAATDRRVRATPAARRVAREMGVDIAAVADWAADGRVLAESDVREFAASRGA